MKKKLNVIARTVDTFLFFLSFLFWLSSIFNIWSYMNMENYFSSEFVEIIVVWFLGILLSAFLTPHLYRSLLELRKPLEEWKILRFLK